MTGDLVETQDRVGSGGRAVERRTVNRGDGGSIPPTAVSKLRQFRSPHICLCFSEETRWSLLSGVYARGSKRSHRGCKCVTCSGLTNSRWNVNALQKGPVQYLIEEEEKKKEMKRSRYEGPRPISDRRRREKEGEEEK